MLTQKDIVRDHNNTPTEIQKFFDDFPWVRQYTYGTVSQVHILPIEPPLLNYHSQSHNIRGMYRDDIVHERILLLDENGSIVISKNKEFLGQRKYWMFGWLFGQPKIYEPTTGDLGCHTVEIKLKKLRDDEAKSIRFILSWYPYNHTVILYKIPKDTTLPEWIKRQT